MATIDVSELSVAGARSLVRASGPSDASEAIVFLHGNPGSSEDWLDLLPRAGDFARALAPDMPGFGRADRPRDFEYSVRGYARHLDGLLNALGVIRVHFVLHDFGGPWGLAWAADHPERVASLSLLNIGLMPGYRWHKYARIWRTPVLGEVFQLLASRAAFRLLIQSDNPKPLPLAFIDRMFEDSDWGSKLAILKLYRATPDLGAPADRIAAALAPFAPPVLVLWSDGDKYLPLSYAALQAKYFEGASIHVLRDSGHWPMIDQPERVRDLLLPFLRQQYGRAPRTLDATCTVAQGSVAADDGTHRPLS
jgi:pimeloyl-ACP methyl ester carboxylesterase